MAGERLYPCLPCADLDASLAFYAALGFAQTYRQSRPNPYAVVARDDMHIHLFGMEGFRPEDSYGNAIVVVPDPDGLYRAFAAGLREAFGRLPVAGAPRLLRPRKKYGTVYGFSVVDPGGNWLRFSGPGAKEPEGREEGLAGAVEVAARLADARGDEATARRTLERALARHADAAALERARAHLYLAELAIRTGDVGRARASLAEAGALPLAPDEREAVAEESAHVALLIEEARLIDEGGAGS